jgi:hypothetical protein
MTLRCECGGSVRIQDGVETDVGFVEKYECEVCGRRGTYKVDTETDTDRTTGCLVSEPEVRV